MCHSVAVKLEGTTLDVIFRGIQSVILEYNTEPEGLNSILHHNEYDKT